MSLSYIAVRIEQRRHFEKQSLARLVQAAAERLKDVTVDIDRSLGTVCIKGMGYDEIFLQGEDAAAFIDEVDRLWEDAEDVSDDDAAKCMALPYVECLWR